MQKEKKNEGISIVREMHRHAFTFELKTSVTKTLMTESEANVQSMATTRTHPGELMKCSYCLLNFVKDGTYFIALFY